jgi:20S proteasome subunit beta 3
MTGKDCVAIACDLRLGMQALTVSNNFPKVFNYAPSTYMGLTGLATDVITVSDLFRYKVNMYRLREERHISPQTLANLVSSSLYERRFGPYFVSPVVAGINQTTGKPFICGFDSIGCIDFAKDFIVSGTASDQLFGTCEGLWEPDLVCLDPCTLFCLFTFPFYFIFCNELQIAANLLTELRVLMNCLKPFLKLF